MCVVNCHDWQVSTQGRPLPRTADEVMDTLVEQQRQLRLLTEHIFSRTINPAKAKMEAVRAEAEKEK